jgi:hypothetical protein
LCERVDRVRSKVGDAAVLDVAFEELCADTVAVVRACCEHLGVEPDEDHLVRCRAVVWEAPPRRSDEVPWTPSALASVAALCAQHAPLQRYAADVAAAGGPAR